MSRTIDRSLYVCSTCDAQHPKWMGQCPTCGSWGTLAPSATPRRAGTAHARIDLKNIPTIGEISVTTTPRWTTGMSEFDGAIGGGIVPGSLLLLAGEPGIGKSTLALQVAAAVGGGEVLYVSGEETAEQIRGRAERLHAHTARVRIFATTDGNAAIAAITQLKPRFAIVDSIQTLTLPELPSDAGGVAQVRTIASLLLSTAKTTGVPILVTGHVTKDGSIAGPKTLEHLVDQVAVLEGEPTSDLRVLRTTKNRFGPTDVVGVFTMSDRGFTACADPSAAFLGGRTGTTAGRSVSATVLGNRVLLVEVQALVTRSAFGQPQRRSVGVDVNRLHLLLAVLARHGKVNLSSSDVHVATVGGFRTDDPASDLAVVAALASAAADRPLPFDVCIGEVGLDGSVRTTRTIERRIQEAVRVGRTRIAAASDVRVPGAVVSNITSIGALVATLSS
ncbi:DNA repair protein RadA [Candidatus Uhrbacteria bacterium]|nr:DNA repair protein RadA [Candidatus Uhrbacteria bacterium]